MAAQSKSMLMQWFEHQRLSGVPQHQTEGLQVANAPAMDLHPRREGSWIGLGLGDFSKCFLMYIMWFAGLKKGLEAGDKKAAESGGSGSS
jgi:hypothetical protein